MNSSLYLNLIFNNQTPNFIIDFFLNGKDNEQVPELLKTFRFTFDNSCNIAGGTQMLCQKDKNEKVHLTISHRFDFDNEQEVGKAYWFSGGLAQYAENSPMSGYYSIHTLMEDATVSIFSYKDQLLYWLHDLKIDGMSENVYFQPSFEYLCSIGHKIKNALGTELEIEQYMKEFNKNVPYPNGSSLFFYPENYNARKQNIADYEPRVEEVVRKCLLYKKIEL